MTTKFWSQNLKGRDSLEYPHVDERIILKYKLKMVLEDVGQVDLQSQHGNMVAKLLFP